MKRHLEDVMRGCRVASAFVLGVLISSEAVAAKLIAVLPLDTRDTDGKMSKAAQHSLEEMLRDVATDALTASGWTILTGETTLQVLQDNGVDAEKCGDQKCLLSWAKEIKAEKFLSGSVQWVEGSYTASVRLIDTASGRILASERVEGQTVKGLRKEFEGKASEFFSKGGMLAGQSLPPPVDAPVPVVAPQVQPAGGHVQNIAAVGTLTVTAKPKDRVRLDLTDPAGNKSASGVPYENKGAKAGTWKVVASATGYATEQQEVEVPADDLAVVKIELKQLGALKVTGSPAGADVEMSGPDGWHDQGELPCEVPGLKSGLYRVTVAKSGYDAAEQTVEVAPGETATLRVKLEKPGGDMVRIPGGTFRMGSEDGESDEKPVTTVTLSPYLMDRTDVTVAAYTACVRAGKCRADDVTTVNWAGLSEGDRQKWSQACNYGKAGDENHPMNCVDWNEAKAYCEAQGSRLPTEAEWEFAARGTDGRKYPWGDELPNPRLANACGVECREWGKRVMGATWNVVYEADDGWPTTSPVGSFPAGASPFGLLDMAGNVWQWVEDAKAAYPGGSITNPRQESGQQRVDRGGSWYSHDAAWLRGALRDDYGATFRESNLGFRCARGAVH
jgi:formylglycine-generating enzyme required for sulfatase activity